MRELISFQRAIINPARNELITSNSVLSRPVIHATCKCGKQHASTTILHEYNDEQHSCLLLDVRSMIILFLGLRINI